MSTEYTIEELELHRSKLKDSVAYAEDVRKLLGNPLFRKVILEDFCIQSAARYVQESCDPLLTAEQRADALALVVTLNVGWILLCVWQIPAKVLFWMWMQSLKSFVPNQKMKLNNNPEISYDYGSH